MAAYRERAGIIGAIQSCICEWPLTVEETETEHDVNCPAHHMLTVTGTLPSGKAIPEPNAPDSDYREDDPPPALADPLPAPNGHPPNVPRRRRATRRKAKR